MLNYSHPEDLIHRAKTFINELQKVQNKYFVELASNLKLTKEGEDWLHDYIYNSADNSYDGFDHYLETFNKQYNAFASSGVEYYNNSAETLTSTDFGEFSPMLHMSSHEPDLETAFPPAYNIDEPFSLSLDTITTEISNARPNDKV